MAITAFVKATLTFEQFIEIKFHDIMQTICRSNIWTYMHKQTVLTLIRLLLTSNANPAQSARKEQSDQE